ncbi:MAG: hypothetical protein UU76_C0004G0012 [Parcubacteria group bacterium GW2011_GWC1_41_7]|nr:MAG: hypothetical protein UU76_C0004G0012 [Parcubacteria group bacterium GW2011_GWC1_41_7]
MNIALTLLVVFFLQSIFPSIAFIAPVLILMFLYGHKQFFIYLLVGSFAQDIFFLTPFGFHLLVWGILFFLCSFLTRIIGIEHFSGLLFFLGLFFLLYLISLGWLRGNMHSNYLAFLFLGHILWALVCAWVYRARMYSRI